MTHVIQTPAKTLPGYLQAALAKWAMEQGKTLEVQRRGYSTTYTMKEVGR